MLLRTILAKIIDLTGKGVINSGGEDFHYEHGIVINTSKSHKPQYGSEWKIVAYHGTHWSSL